MYRHYCAIYKKKKRKLKKATYFLFNLNSNAVSARAHTRPDGDTSGVSSWHRAHLGRRGQAVRGRTRTHRQVPSGHHRVRPKDPGLSTQACARLLRSFARWYGLEALGRHCLSVGQPQPHEARSQMVTLSPCVDGRTSTGTQCWSQRSPT